MPNRIARLIVGAAALRVGTRMMPFRLSSPVDRPQYPGVWAGLRQYLADLADRA
ncbi:MAG: hypothetical protein M3N42_10050 [Cyanobacteriota bacterium]|nr:hypothetical protein [Cyanobacteriota bacterium]